MTDQDLRPIHDLPIPFGGRHEIFVQTQIAYQMGRGTSPAAHLVPKLRLAQNAGSGGATGCGPLPC